MVTQKDVADLAGVSFITVSRVVRGEENVKPETRRKVEEAIAKLGYAPSFAGQVLNSGRCNTIGVLTPIPLYKSMRSFYLMSVLSGINDICYKNGTDILMNIVPESEKNANYDYLRAYRQKKVDGIIYVGLKKITQEMTDEIKLRKLPCVVIADRPEADIFSWVDTDNFLAAKNTVNELWKRGHRRLAFLGLNKNIYNANVAEREKGFVERLKQLGVDYNPQDYVIRTDYDSELINEDVEKAFKTFKEKPTALFCCTDSCVPGACKGLKNLGLSIPEDVSIVGFDGFINETNFPLNVATNVQPLVQMGQRAADILFNHINNPDAQRENVILNIPYVDGASVRNLLNSN